LNHQFYGLPEEERKKTYKTNIANTFPYQANDALIDTSIMKVVEQFKSEDKISKIPFEIPDMEELRKHRIVISHPSNIKFSDPDVQKFYDADLHYKDSKAIRLWRVRDVIIKKIEEIGGTVKFPNEITVQLGTQIFDLKGVGVTTEGQPGLSGEYHSPEAEYFTGDFIASFAAGYFDGLVQRRTNAFGQLETDPSVDSAVKKGLASGALSTADRFREKLKKVPEFSEIKGPFDLKILILEQPKSAQ